MGTAKSIIFDQIRGIYEWINAFNYFLLNFNNINLLKYNFSLPLKIHLESIQSSKYSFDSLIINKYD